MGQKFFIIVILIFSMSCVWIYVLLCFFLLLWNWVFLRGGV